MKHEKSVPAAGLSLAMRMSTDLASAIFVGGGIGYLLDYWLHTSPWMTVIFFLFGSVAGFRNVYRIAMAPQESHGDEPPQAKGPEA